MIHTTDLQGAVETLDTIIEEMRYAKRQGVEVSVEQLALIALKDPDDAQSRARTALVLAVALQRLAQ